MSNRPFRFVHASDFHLERPPSGVSEVPDHLQELFIESPYWAAERVFETVLAEDAELLVLSGNVLDAQQTGPRGPLFLVEQFRRLDERNIPVYWIAGTAEGTDFWPASYNLPRNVHLIPAGRTEEFVHHRDSLPLVRLICVSGPRQGLPREMGIEADLSGLFTVVAAHGTFEAESLRATGVHYWALGGRPQRDTLFSAPHVAHYSGSSQGRNPQQQGQHGCTLVQVDDQAHVRTTPVATDGMRWFDASLAVDETTTRDALQAMLDQQMQSLIETAPSIDLLVSWSVTGDGPLFEQLRRGGLARELLDGLRKQYGFGPPAAWSVGLRVNPPAQLPDQWYEQESIRGDFLCAIRQLEMNPDVPWNLQQFVAEQHLAGLLSERLEPDNETQRRRILREASQLGVDLLTGEETES